MSLFSTFGGGLGTGALATAACSSAPRVARATSVAALPASTSSILDSGWSSDPSVAG
jgi:hypothetical protein